MLVVKAKLVKMEEYDTNRKMKKVMDEKYILSVKRRT